MQPTDTAGSVLQALLDDTDFYARAQWAYFLHTTETDIEWWVQNKSLPAVRRLCMLLDLLELRGGEGAVAPLARWKEMLTKPIAEVVPILKEKTFACGASTLDEYLKIPCFAPPMRYQPFLEFVCKKHPYTDEYL